MGLVLEIKIPFGRFSANPWGRHVNEGVVEIPPSPWRLVRALLSAWHSRCLDLSEIDVISALELLCSPPRCRIPRHTVATTRHYMPDRSGGSSLVLNSFAAVDPEHPVEMYWDVDPSPAHMQILTKLAGAVSYLGRAESRVVLSFRTGPWDVDDGSVLHPGLSDGLDDRSALDLLVPTTPLDLAAMETTTGEMHAQRRLVPDGVARVRYAVREPEQPVRRRLARPRSTAQVVIFSIHTRPLPSLKYSAPLASLFKSAVTSKVPDLPSLHGHNGGETGSAREDDHAHAHYLGLPSRLGIERLVLWVPEGESTTGLAGLSRLRRLNPGPRYIPGSPEDGWGVSLDAIGDVTVLPEELFAPAKRWRTVTPVATGRHRHRNQSVAAFGEDVLRRELKHRDLPHNESEVSIESVQRSTVTWGSRQAAIRSRRHTTFDLVIKFQRPIAGPLVLGSLAHFSLGLFKHG